MSTSHFRGRNIVGYAKLGFQPTTSVLKIFQEALRRNGDHLALIDGDTGETIISSQLLQQSNRIAAGLQSAGVSPGDVIVLCCDKSILAYILLLGVMFTGATAVLTQPPHADKIDKLTSGKTVKALFYDSAFSESVIESVARMTPPPNILGKTDPSDPIISKFLDSDKEFKLFQVEDTTKHVPVVLFTSGTTGLPKGVEITDRAAQLSGYLTPPNMESLLVASPLYWYSGLSTLVGSISDNYTLIVTNSKDARRRLQLIEKYKIVSIFAALENMVQTISEPSLVDNIDLSSVKHVIAGGELILPSVAHKFVTKVMKGRVDLSIVYGSTEAGHVTILEVEDLDVLQIGAVGKARPGVEIKILDDYGHVVQPGVTGRIWVNTLATKGYWRSDDDNLNFLDGEGFYDTGDAGFFDAEGNLYLRGRIYDLINFRGVKDSPAILEDLLMTHPSVQEVAVVGKPHPTDVQHPTAFVVLRPEYRYTVTDHDIIAFVDGHVEDSKKLRGGVNFCESIPRVSAGKVNRRLI